MSFFARPNPSLKLTKHRCTLGLAPLALILLATLLPGNVLAYDISDNGDTVILTGATLNEYDHVTNTLAPHLRVRYFNVDDGFWDAEDAKYSAILEPNSDQTPVTHFVDLTLGQFNSHVASLHGNAEMMQVEVYSIEGEERFGLLAYHREGPDWEVHSDVPPQWEAAFEESLPPGLNRVNRCRSYTWPSYVTTLYKDDKTDTIDMNASMTANEFKIMRDILAKEGYRVTSMEVRQDYLVGIYPAPLFRPIFKRNGNLAFTTQADSQGTSAIIGADHFDDLSHMTPTWIALADRWARDANGHFLENYDATYICGFLGTPKFNPDLPNELYGGDSSFTATPKPFEQAKPLKNMTFKSK